MNGRVRMRDTSESVRWASVHASLQTARLKIHFANILFQHTRETGVQRSVEKVWR